MSDVEPLHSSGPGGLSAYHLAFRTAGQPVHVSEGYHWVHRAQLRALNAIDADPRLAAFRDAMARAGACAAGAEAMTAGPEPKAIR